MKNKNQQTKRILVVDVGGNNVKIRVTGKAERRKFPSGPELSPAEMVEGVLELTRDWTYEVISLGFPGPVEDGRLEEEPKNLGTGWVDFDFEAAFGKPVRILNDAAMQALGSYRGEGRMLFLGLGTGLGSAIVEDWEVEPMELAHLPYRNGRTYEDYVGEEGRQRRGDEKWRESVLDVIDRLSDALQVDYTVVGGGNAKRFDKWPDGVFPGDNANAFLGGFRMWETGKKIGMVGLGKMGGNMTRRLLRGGHSVVAHDIDPAAVEELAREGAMPAATLRELVQRLEPPRLVWVMVPAGAVVEKALAELGGLLSAGDIVIDGGNCNYQETRDRGARLAEKQVHLVDVGTSGGVWGLDQGYSLMVGGSEEAVAPLRPFLETLAPAVDQGWGHVGPSGAGHFVKMVHNGIEYGMMEAFAEGFAVMDAKSEMELDLHQVAEIWRHGSVIRSWLLDLTSRALAENPDLDDIAPFVPDSGEGRWTVKEAIDLDVPAPVITASLIQRLQSREDDSFAFKLLAAMRNQFGGHAVKKAE